jgi:hypothetical protein
MREAQFARYEQLQREAEKSAAPANPPAKPAESVKLGAPAKSRPEKPAAKKSKAKKAKKKSGR